MGYFYAISLSTTDWLSQKLISVITFDKLQEISQTNVYILREKKSEIKIYLSGK